MIVHREKGLPLFVDGALHWSYYQNAMLVDDHDGRVLCISNEGAEEQNKLEMTATKEEHICWSLKPPMHSSDTVKSQAFKVLVDPCHSPEVLSFAVLNQKFSPSSFRFSSQRLPKWLVAKDTHGFALFNGIIMRTYDDNIYKMNLF